MQEMLLMYSPGQLSAGTTGIRSMQVYLNSYSFVTSIIQHKGLLLHLVSIATGTSNTAPF
jgi:hypothetical protein